MDRLEGSAHGTVVRALPLQELLDPASAAAYLGLAPGVFRILALLRCLPRPLTIREAPFYRRVDLNALRESWLGAVNVRAEDRIVAAVDEEGMAAPLDPLMRLLALRAIRHRIVVSIFWSMGIVGGAICLTLY
ncbi:hypothetical protein [Swaminathania salitolerans]|uniref:Uncharacterized protein n=1 Tax=Swaminathania salitolerans TaxID=182838 RepID=A0A511BXH1_9PROT|nr:hypothetical protein [Swaminathania salitolerans]GBQ12063.1 hypothetical protein AA21291_1059 [Swaminathania salitolerans LMG 21291]GEL02718.1 hypothetical protein SSA02_18810 [Swaminathania salitolerans]